jgi:hypothetical protein
MTIFNIWWQRKKLNSVFLEILYFLYKLETCHELHIFMGAVENSGMQTWWHVSSFLLILNALAKYMSLNRSKYATRTKSL